MLSPERRAFALRLCAVVRRGGADARAARNAGHPAESRSKTLAVHPRFALTRSPSPSAALRNVGHPPALRPEALGIPRRFAGIAGHRPGAALRNAGHPPAPRPETRAIPQRWAGNAALPRTAPTRFDVGAGSGVAELVPGCLARTDPLIALLPAPNLAGVGPGQGTVQIDLAFGPATPAATWTLQAWIVDLGVPDFLAGSNAVVLEVQ